MGGERPDKPVKLSDNELTESGLNATGKGRVLVLACGALAHEIIALKEANGWDHIELACLPAIFHNHPEKITPAVREAVANHKATYSTIFLAYADCGTGGHLQAAAKELGVEMIEGPHCYSFLEGNAIFASRGQDEMRAFFLTDFLVRQFETFVWKPLGLDRHPELRDMYFGNYEKLVYQAQTDDPALDAKANDCAEKLGLRYERRLVGYGDLETSLSGL